LHGVAVHAIHKLPIFGIRSFLPDFLFFSCFAVNYIEAFTPTTLDLVCNLVGPRVNLSLRFLVSRLAPSTFEELQLSVGAFRVRHIFNGHLSYHIQVWCTDNDVIYRYTGTLNFKSFIVRQQFDVVLILIDDGDGTFDEFRFRSKSGSPTVTTFTFSIIRYDGWMMHDKFSEHLVLPRLGILICLTKHGIERFLHRTLQMCLLYHAIDGYIC